MEKNIGRLVKKASNQLGREFDQFAKPFDLTGMQMSIIDFISYGLKEEYFQQDIEKEFNIQRSTTTVLLQRMEKKELIYRQVSQKDARQKSVHLTQKAQDLVAECRSYFQLQEKELEERFSEDEIAIFEKILDYYVKKK
ncbi:MULTISPECIES: MarR family transcriptional regulator [Streptococcus]|jgi:MarR family transcriptional repressor of mepA|uniref:MarR family transcriptional regulator n=3 Tax=Streptococcus TaxID=1301 RepID=A0ABY7LX47_STRAY|nr:MULTISPECIES: MarR family transcriptional regulator [Streptococcus]MDE2587092.1 MarR family transcriptional regulator [Lactobacillales bacterium]MBD9120215.1 MarR family transcriptional regulator [Streptococcus sp.]MCI6904318.1 MarR family transcriptional regulator [Streptococcus alactolyticus]MDD7361558.1 MarR family transcriptional regulator [Streptococcus alactolyticus]MDY5187710.1 MarR family transcriptional regulator [Streptococcus alactolyticus]